MLSMNKKQNSATCQNRLGHIKCREYIQIWLNSVFSIFEGRLRTAPAVSNVV